jgi:menaquinone-dependent protoporphyrinogen IX oxidase
LKHLVVYYSRTGTTKKVALAICSHLQADCEALIDTKKRTGVLGYLRAGRDARAKALTTLHEPQYSPHDYDVVILGTPVWRNTVSTPVRTYISRYNAQFKYVAFFTTQRSEKRDVLQELRELCDQIPLALLTLRADAVKQNAFQDELTSFIDDVRHVPS